MFGRVPYVSECQESSEGNVFDERELAVSKGVTQYSDLAEW